MSTTAINPSSSCTILTGLPNGTSPGPVCTGWSGAVGHVGWWSPFNRFRTLKRYDLNAQIPPSVAIISAVIKTTWKFGGDKTYVHVHEAEKPWTTSATWTTYDGVHPWEAPGGDYGPDLAAPQRACCTGQATWDVTDVARDWQSNATPNYGVIFQSPDTEPYALPALDDTQLIVTYIPSNYWASVQYGGANGQIDSSAEAAEVGAALAGPNTLAIWNATRPDDRNFLMDEQDPNFGVWARKVDTVGPAKPTGIGLDDKELASSRSSFSWLEGDDPPLRDADGALSNGSGGDEFRSEYRYRRAGGTWSAWTTTSGLGFNLSPTRTGEVINLEVKAFDRAGNPSAVAAKSVTIRPPTGPAPTQSAQSTQSAALAVPVVVVGCAAFCVKAAVATAGATAAAVAFVHTVQVDELSFGLFGDDNINVTEVELTSQSFDDFQEEAKRSSERRRFREEGRAADEDSSHGRIHPGEEGHHIVAVGAKGAEYARKVLWRCNLDPNDWQVNGAHPKYRFHKRMHTKAYYQAINRILKRYDPDRNITPCDPFDDAFSNGIRTVLRDIAKYINRGKFPG